MFDVKHSLLIKSSLKRNPQTEIDLCLYNPIQTLKALNFNKKIKDWHSYILNDYKPKISEILLLFPCAANKPWNEGLTKSKNYEILYKLLNYLNLREQVSLHTISEPLGIIGECDYGKMPIYDNPGLFHWFTKKFHLKWDEDAYNKCLKILGTIIGKFLIKFGQKFKYIIAFVKPNSNHEKMIKIAKKFLKNIEVIIRPTKEESRTLKNNYVWMENKKIQKLFLKYLRAF